uniref:Uncharacterized protein n=1 Tax=Micrurus corallinus TaxID=54390 RepID=A0A2D4EVJ9_MICCO
MFLKIIVYFTLKPSFFPSHLAVLKKSCTLLRFHILLGYKPSVFNSVVLSELSLFQELKLSLINKPKMGSNKANTSKSFKQMQSREQAVSRIDKPTDLDWKYGPLGEYR